MSTLTLIDAHGSDHGLRVELWNRTLTIVQYGECCEPDEHGSYSKRLGHYSCGLAEALAGYRSSGGGDFDRHPSQTSRVIAAALHMHCHSGDDHVEWLDDDDMPTDHFCEDLDARRK